MQYYIRGMSIAYIRVDSAIKKALLENNITNWNNYKKSIPKDVDLIIEDEQVSRSNLLSLDLKHIKFKRCSFNNVIFANIDFSNSKFVDCYFYQDEFLNCKFNYCIVKNSFMQNCNTTNSIFNHTEIIESNMSSVIGMCSHLEQCTFIDSEIPEAVQHYKINCVCKNY
jgi:uncharacterized protein YjbI with pentapeptide repeats